jgi:T5SS/PEP-CTERM-associated repeat protein
LDSGGRFADQAADGISLLMSPIPRHLLLDLCRRAGSISRTTMSGTGATWTNQNMLVVSGLADVTIEDGGALISGDAFIAGISFTDFGSVTVKDSGSTWTSNGDIAIGVSPSGAKRYGSLIVSDGDSVSVTGNLIVGSGLEALSAALLGGGTAAANVTNNDLVRPGLAISGFSPQTLHIEGDFSQAETGQLVIQLKGTTPGSGYDQLHVNGAVALDGKLVIAPYAFQPSAGDVFDILDWTTLRGTFSMIDLSLASLPSGLRWDMA